MARNLVLLKGTKQLGAVGRKQPGFREKVENIWQMALESLEVDGKVIFAVKMMHAWKVV